MSVFVRLEMVDVTIIIRNKPLEARRLCCNFKRRDRFNKFAMHIDILIPLLKYLENMMLIHDLSSRNTFQAWLPA